MRSYFVVWVFKSSKFLLDKSIYVFDWKIVRQAKPKISIYHRSTFRIYLAASHLKYIISTNYDLTQPPYVKTPIVSAFYFKFEAHLRCDVTLNELRVIYKSSTQSTHLQKVQIDTTLEIHTKISQLSSKESKQLPNEQNKFL